MGVAAAETGGAAGPGEAEGGKGSPSGSPASSPSAGVLTLISAETSPRKSFYFGYRCPRLTYTIGSTQPENDLRIDVVNAAGEVVKTFYRENVAPEAASTIRWDGSTNEGRPAHNGRYSFRISPQGESAPAARKATASTTLSLGFSFYGYDFPVLGKHEFEMGAGRFGARARATRTGYQSAAGNYLVIDGRGTGFDFMYAHLAEPPRSTPATPSAPASRSASSATPATPKAATSTSRCRPHPAGTKAASRSTRFPIWRRWDKYS